MEHLSAAAVAEVTGAIWRRGTQAGATTEKKETLKIGEVKLVVNCDHYRWRGQHLKNELN